MNGFFSYSLEDFKEIICYPLRFFDERCFRRLEDLRSSGVEEVLEYGDSMLLGRRVLGKGFSSVVVLGRHSRYGISAIKIRRFDSKRDSLENEARLLMRVSETGFAPRVYHYSRDFIIREFIEGPRLGDFIDSISGDSISLTRLTRSLIISANTLDLLSVDLEEISRADKQIIIRNKDPEKIYYIDLESARTSLNASNTTRILSYIINKRIIRETLGLDVEKIREVYEIARNYKREKDPWRKRILAIEMIDILTNQRETSKH
ncbi:MAG: hypothetical protein QXE13_05600 [Sulfolobales archaeon]